MRMVSARPDNSKDREDEFPNRRPSRTGPFPLRPAADRLPTCSVFPCCLPRVRSVRLIMPPSPTCRWSSTCVEISPSRHTRTRATTRRLAPNRPSRIRAVHISDAECDRQATVDGRLLPILGGVRRRCQVLSMTDQRLALVGRSRRWWAYRSKLYIQRLGQSSRGNYRYFWSCSDFLKTHYTISRGKSVCQKPARYTQLFRYNTGM